MRKTSDYIWEIPITYKKGMRVSVRIIATEKLLQEMDEGVFEQSSNVATLPGIIEAVYVMPDAHWGYGFPIGGVAAFDVKEGVISPGGIGFDINCGVRLLLTNLKMAEVRPRLPELVGELFKAVPSGVGTKGFVKLTVPEFKEAMVKGMQWAIKKGFGWEEDVRHAEEYGQIKGADPEAVSNKAIERGIGQLGTLGSGNHYLEIQQVLASDIFDQTLASQFGIFPDQIAVMIHCGSRGFGHQVATDYLSLFEKIMPKYGIAVPDQQLACAPFGSLEGKSYYSAMIAAANAAFANRQIIMHRVREVFAKVFGKSAESLGMRLIYDVAHNIAKLESKRAGEQEDKKILVHRKGATRSFGPGHPELPEIYQKIGQPVMIGGSMETGSYLLVGTKKAEELTFGSTAHGSGRTMSRAAAKKIVRGEKLQKEMEGRGIYVKSASFAGLAEEAGLAYKDITEVVRAVELAGISKPVVKFTPIGNIKG